MDISELKGLPLDNIEDMLFIVLSETATSLETKIKELEAANMVAYNSLSPYLKELERATLEKIRNKIYIKRPKHGAAFKLENISYNGKDINICLYDHDHMYYFCRENKADFIINIKGKIRKELEKLFNNSCTIRKLNAKHSAIIAGLGVCAAVKSGGLTHYYYRDISNYGNILGERTTVYMTAQQIREKYDYLALAAELRIKGNNDVTDEMVSIIKSRLLD